MGNDLEKSRKETLAPSRRVRLALWFGIYLFGFGIFLIIMAAYDQQMRGDPDVDQDIGVRRLSWMLLLFPCGLASFFRCFSDFSGFFLSYVIYLLHLTLTYRVKSGRIFVLLMLVLVALVSCNVIGCSVLTTIPMAR